VTIQLAVVRDDALLARTPPIATVLFNAATFALAAHFSFAHAYV